MGICASYNAIACPVHDGIRQQMLKCQCLGASQVHSTLQECTPIDMHFDQQKSQHEIAGLHRHKSQHAS